MTDLISEGRRLHEAIVAWGNKHGVWAYRVVTPDHAFFEIYDPKNKTISHDFPSKIQAAIDKNADALKAYAAWTRKCDAGWPMKPTLPTPAGVGSGDPGETKNPRRRH